MTATEATTSETLYAALPALLEEIAARATDGERERTMPAGLVAPVEAAGLFRILRTRDLGGLELDPVEVVDVIERLAHADGSAAWTILIGATASAFFGWLAPEAATALLGSAPDAAASCMFAPSGIAVPDGEGYRVSGHWQWNSGIAHAPWRQVGVLVGGPDGRPAPGPDGAPQVRIAIVPATDGVVVDHWDTMGLRGTGSHDLVLDGVSVPSEHTFGFVGTSHHARATVPYARFGLLDLVHLGVVGFPLGIARRALDEVAERVAGKVRGLAERWSVAEDSEVQADIGRAEGELAAARALADSAAAELWRSAQSPEGPSEEAQQRLALASPHALRAALRVVDTALRHAGASSIRTDDPLQRCFRDLHAVAGHVFYAADADRAVGRRRIGATASLVSTKGGDSRI
jgi:indole-3-acetate monooxygenase